MKKEIWKAIVGYEGFYEVSNLGTIRSVTRYIPNGRGSMSKRTCKIMCAYKDNKGYLRVKLSTNNMGASLKVHRLVAEAFLPKPVPRIQVNHKDGVKTNNKINNLEWVTAFENMQHATKLGLMHKAAGKDHCRARAVVQLDPKTLKVIQRFNTISEAARYYNFWHTAIRNVCWYWYAKPLGLYKSKKACKTYKNFIWRYIDE